MADNDIPSFRKGALLHIAAAIGTPEDAQALRDRIAAGLPFTEDFVQPIQARLDAALAETDARIAAAEAAAQQ